MLYGIKKDNYFLNLVVLSFWSKLCLKWYIFVYLWERRKLFSYKTGMHKGYGNELAYLLKPLYHHHTNNCYYAFVSNLFWYIFIMKIYLNRVCKRYLTAHTIKQVNVNEFIRLGGSYVWRIFFSISLQTNKRYYIYIYIRRFYIYYLENFTKVWKTICL